jgi:hypothetical protein
MKHHIHTHLYDPDYAAEGCTVLIPCNNSFNLHAAKCLTLRGKKTIGHRSDGVHGKQFPTSQKSTVAMA